ncbi:MAG: NAD(P)(+) transhydrogenase (Re/Si-specific) subunit beta [Holosporaceae bacterium]|jgi:NAD(P) transhydrogenase subunit beta|nr:NAD(P)(+) transhydrogenase (Re/Si-specific) subunit beta [Holosporaceae bacterium]
MTIDILYLIAAVCFIFALRGLSSPQSAFYGNCCGIAGIVLSCVATYIFLDISGIIFTLVAMAIGAGIGIYIAGKVSMTALPQMVAGFHSLVGLAAVLVAFAAYFAPGLFHLIGAYGICKFSLIEMGLGSAIGAITFSGAVVAFLKLEGLYKGTAIPAYANALLLSLLMCMLTYFVATNSATAFVILTIFSFLFGITLIAPIGGADMPVIVSMLNSYSGWAAAGIGFTLHSDLLIITGAIVGTSGAILGYIMCKSMNRSLLNVILAGGQCGAQASANALSKSKAYKNGSAEDIAFLLKNAESVIIVPGYGMATSQAQHALKEMSAILKKEGIKIRYAIHPVAGRMPGHMNVLLAEANVPYEDVCELDEINRDFASCDVAYVIGANDVTNPAAKHDTSSSIYGMQILEVEKAKAVVFLKRSMGTGYAGVDNELFYAPNTMMLLGDAKKTTEEVIKELQNVV